MKKSITRIMAALALLVTLAIPMGMRGQTRAEVVTYTLDGTITATGNAYATATELTQNDITWMVTANTEMSPWRIGGKNLEGVDRPVYSIDPIPGNITKIVVEHGTASSITVNSWTVFVASDANFANVVSTLTPTFTAGSSTTINRPAGADWTDCYYKFVYNVSVNGNTNRFVQFVKAEFYKQEGANPTCATPTFNPAAGTYTQAQSVSISCATEDATIYYTTNGDNPTTNSTVYTAAINVSSDMTIKAMATAEGYDNSAIATAAYTIVNIEHAGTEADPYTVADARAAIDANVGVTGVYATGIVSEIVTAYNSTYGNITFDIVDEVGNSATLRAYRCGGTEAANVAVNDIVVVYGDLTKYGSTYEFGQDCQLVSLTHPAVAVEAPTFSPVAGTYAEVQTVAISSETEGADIYYTLDGTDPTMESSMYENPITVSETTTIKAIAVNGDDVASNVASANYYFCSADDPYTVTEALAFQAYQYPANGIYVHGIVSTAPTQAPTNNGELTYYISVDGEATNQLEVYKGKGLEQAAFTAQDDLQVGDIVTVYGNVQVYNSTIEFATGNYLVSFERPEVPVVPSITVTPATVEVDAEEHDGTLDLAYENLEISDMTDFDIQYYDAEGEETETPDWIEVLVAEQDPEIGEGYVVSYNMSENEGEARSAYFKVFAVGDEDFVYSNLVTINQAEYVVPALDYAELPFEFDGGRADIENTDGLTQEGLDTDYSSSPKLKFNTTGDWLLLHFNEQPGTLTFDIKGNGFSGGTFTVQTSEDGETYTDLATYTSFGSSVESEEFTNLAENVRYIKWIYTEKSNGNVALGNIVLDEYTGPVASISVADAIVSVPAEGAEGTLTVTYENISEIVADVYFCDADGQEFTYEWMTAEIDDDNNVEYLVEPNEGEARTAYFKVYAMDDEGELVYSNLVTVNQEAPVTPVTPGTWVLTSLADLTEDDIFVIVGDNGDTYAMSNDEGTQHAPATVEVIVTEGTLSGEPAANIQWNLEITNDGYVFYPNGTTESWLYCINDNNGVRVGTGEAKHFTLDNTSGYLTITETTDQRYLGIYNSQDWRCYKNTTGNIADQTFAFYKKVETLPANSIVIEGYGESEGGYYLIASPFTVSPEDVQGMTEGEYDLYSFDEAEENEWRNYKAGAFTNLEPGKGYLYAHSTTVTLTFDGTPYDGEPIVLKKTAGGDFPGWNLVGNPYTETAYIDRDFYVMNPDTGGEIITGEGNEIAPMQGFFVIAANNGEELEISTTAPAEQGGKIVMNVSNGRSSVIDRAMVRFGEGRTLPKFMLNDENTKIYFTEGNEDFAVVRSIDENATPVNFHAAENGTYTLSINAENVEMEYLHLLDNMTGADVDLLATPSYTFEARTTDYANRFKLVYATTTDVNENNVEPFAFFNGSEWVINNEGEATLQVIDINGRMLSNETVNGNANVNINATSGIYMLRLVNGESVKTQKVVVK